MTDRLLVERLRKWADEFGCECSSDVCCKSVALLLMREAADHIEGLEAQISDAEGAEDVQCPTMDGP